MRRLQKLTDEEAREFQELAQKEIEVLYPLIVVEKKSL